MIKFKTAGGKILGIGLSRGNWEKLMEGDPILFDASEIGGLKGITSILIMGGETEDEICQALSIVKVGAILEGK